ncbi:Coiled-coil domain-containing protein 40 [Cichlidogyrus casuarinus]|uniref:Coiled-coil domain-containing protein 40 n=1 Tax=Cichlidogyrus casuarinus TaxID=1844966 RepID=A0ABD2QB70_9PLAT
MHWEKKAQLAEEAKEAVNSHVETSDANDMKMEIQRMELKKKGLLREQECLTQELEKAVHKREILIDKNEFNKSKNKKDSKETVTKETNQLKNKIAAIEKDIKLRNEQVDELAIETGQMYEKLNMIKAECQAKQEEINACTEMLPTLAFQKHLSVLDLNLNQQQLIMWRSFSEGKFRPIFKSTENCLSEINKHTTRILALTSILDDIMKEHPKLKPDLEPLKMLLEAKQTILDAYAEPPSSRARDDVTPVPETELPAEESMTQLPSEHTLVPTDHEDDLDENPP